MSETTTAIFTELKNISKDVGTIKGDIRVLKLQSEQKVDKVNFLTSLQKLKDYMDARFKSCFKENHPVGDLTKTKIDWVKTLKNSIFIFGASAGFGSGLAAVIMKIFG